MLESPSTSPTSPITRLPLSSDYSLEEVRPENVEQPDPNVSPKSPVQPITEAEDEPTPVETPPRRRSSIGSSLKHIVRPPPRVIGPLHPRTILLFMPASVLGLLARLGLDALCTYPGASIFPLAWVQAAGCFCMGAFLGLREPISEYYPELYTALTSGFCGSLTTFSSWQLDVFLAFSNRQTPGGYHRLWIYDIMDGLTRLLFTLAISMAALSFGYKLTTETAPEVQRFLRKIFTPSTRIGRDVTTFISVAIYGLTIPMYFVLSPAFRSKATAALLFSFPGALTRYLLSVYLNPLHKGVPPGTFAANTLGTGFLATFHVLQRSRHGALGPTACVMLQGLIDGYCGCLSTVSTFASELRTLQKWQAWRYAAVSVVVGQALMVLIVGSAEWSGSVHDQITCRAR